MRNRRRRKAKHRCQKATKQGKGSNRQEGGGGLDKESNALNIQTFIDASVRNGFDTLKTILKFFFFKIYTSEASKQSSCSCSDSVRSQHYFDFFSWSPIGPQIKWDSIQFPRVERLSSPASPSSSSSYHHHAELLDSHTQVQVPVKSVRIRWSKTPSRKLWSRKMFHPSTFQMWSSPEVQGINLCHQASIFHQA